MDPKNMQMQLACPNTFFVQQTYMTVGTRVGSFGLVSKVNATTGCLFTATDSDGRLRTGMSGESPSLYHRKHVACQ